jgi:hypothetical protein
MCVLTDFGDFALKCYACNHVNRALKGGVSRHVTFWTGNGVLPFCGVQAPNVSILPIKVSQVPVRHAVLRSKSLLWPD